MLILQKKNRFVPSLGSKVTYEDPDRNESENIHSWKNHNKEILLCKNETFDIVEAKLKELENWKNNKIYSEVDNEGQSQIPVRWVITEKIIECVSRTKARLVAQGFKEMDSNTIRKNSPTCGRENLRLILLIINLNGWKINTMDIKSEILQGKPIESDVYLKPPKEAHTKKTSKLNTAVYGLDDVPGVWYLCVKEELLKTGGIKKKYDNAIFYWHQNNRLQSILSSHVDDFFWAGTEWFIENVIENIRKKYAISKEETETFKYHDFRYSRKMVESKYIKKIIQKKFRVFQLIIPVRKTVYCHPRKLSS